MSTIVELEYNPTYFRASDRLDITSIVDTLPPPPGTINLLAILTQAAPVVNVTIVIALLVWKYR